MSCRVVLLLIYGILSTLSSYANALQQDYFVDLYVWNKKNSFLKEEKQKKRAVSDNILFHVLSGLTADLSVCQFIIFLVCENQNTSSKRKKNMVGPLHKTLK